MSWFDLGWSPADDQLLAYWSSKKGKLIKIIDETDCDADEFVEEYQGKNPFSINLVPTGRKRKGFTKGERNIILEIKGKVCIHCDERDTKLLQIDHIDGNPNNSAIENLQLLCYPCHKAKHSVESIKKRAAKA